MDGRTILILSGAGLVGLACGTTRLNAGSNGDGGTPSVDAGPQGLPWLGTPSNSFELKCELPAPDWIAGAWQGEFDTYTLRSGSKAVRIEFTGENSAANQLCGTVTFGGGAPPPVATDPQAPPPGTTDPPLEIIGGFAYEFGPAGKSIAGFDAGAPAAPPGERRVRFDITQNQAYKSWCNLQLSYAQFDLSTLDITNPPKYFYRCVPKGAYNDGWNGQPFNGSICDSGLVITGASCAQALYCYLDVCSCGPGASAFNGYTASVQGCTVYPTGETKFDLSLAGTILSGNVEFKYGIEGLHLTRAP